MADDSRWPDFENAITRVWPEMPKEAQAVRDVRPMGWFEKWKSPQAAAVTKPDGTIAYNKAMAYGRVDPNDLMAHELTHVRQANRGGGLLQELMARFFSKDAPTSYQDSDIEKEAFAQEASRAGKRVRLDDIKLR